MCTQTHTNTPQKTYIFLAFTIQSLSQDEKRNSILFYSSFEIGSHYVALDGFSTCRPGWPQIQRQTAASLSWVSAKTRGIWYHTLPNVQFLSSLFIHVIQIHHEKFSPDLKFISNALLCSLSKPLPQTGIIQCVIPVIHTHLPVYTYAGMHMPALCVLTHRHFLLMHHHVVYMALLAHGVGVTIDLFISMRRQTIFFVSAA